MPVVRLPATPDGGQPPRLRPEDIAEIPPFRPSFKPEDLAEIPPFRGALDEIPPWQPPVTTSPVSSNPEGPDFIDDDASYDDAPVTNDAGTEYCVLCARAVEFSADGKHGDAAAQMDAALATGLASEDPVMLTTARVDGDRAYFGDGLLSEGVEVVEGDSLLHLLLRNEAAVDTVNACLKGGADVRAVNARGEHCVGLARKARAKAGQRRGNSETATAEAAARREVAAQVAQLVDKKAAQGGAPPRISMGTPQKSGPSTPKSPGRRLKTPDKRGAPSPVSAAREVDCWRRVAARATEAADAVEAKVRGFVVEGDPDQMGERAVTATRTTLAEALACRGETSSDAELYARDLQRLRDDCRISQTAEGEARSLYVELEAAHEELLVRAQETEAECRRWREGDERKKHRRERARLENERDALRDENDALRAEMAKWRAWVKERGDTLEAYGRRAVQAELDAARARLNKVLKMTEALQAKNVQKAAELGLAKRRPQSARPRPQSAGPARKAVAMSASLAQLPAV